MRAVCRRRDEEGAPAASAHLYRTVVRDAERRGIIGNTAREHEVGRLAADAVYDEHMLGLTTLDRRACLCTRDAVSTALLEVARLHKELLDMPDRAAAHPLLHEDMRRLRRGMDRDGDCSSEYCTRDDPAPKMLPVTEFPYPPKESFCH